MSIDEGGTSLVLFAEEEKKVQLLTIALRTPTSPPILPRSGTSGEVKDEAMSDTRGLPIVLVV